jgi:hypothetical protein
VKGGEGGDGESPHSEDSQQHKQETKAVTTVTKGCTRVTSGKYAIETAADGHVILVSRAPPASPPPLFSVPPPRDPLPLIDGDGDSDGGGDRDRGDAEGGSGDGGEVEGLGMVVGMFVVPKERGRVVGLACEGDAIWVCCDSGSVLHLRASFLI